MPVVTQSLDPDAASDDDATFAEDDGPTDPSAQPDAPTPGGASVGAFPEAHARARSRRGSHEPAARARACARSRASAASTCVRVDGPSARGRAAALAALLAQARLLDVHRRLSRFDTDSDLCRLNADPQPVVAAGRLLRLLARAVVDAGERSGGLVDATLVGELERAGYAASRAATRRT